MDVSKHNPPPCEALSPDHVISSSHPSQIPPLLPPTVLGVSYLGSSIKNIIPETAIHQDSPQSPSSPVIITKDSPVHPSSIQNASPHSESAVTAFPLHQSSSPYPIALLTSTADGLKIKQEYDDETLENDVNQNIPVDKQEQDTTTRYVCTECGKTYKLKASLARHRKTHDNPLTCTLCGEQFAHTGSLKRHKDNKHLGITYPCEQCYKVFSDSYSLKQHAREHSDDFRFKCDLCGKGFNNNQSYQAHVNRHANKRPFQCASCGRDFLFCSSFTRHNKSCGAKPTIPCPNCGKLFKSKRYLKDHMIKYSNPLQHTCHVCGLCFSHRSTLYKHMKRRHSQK